MTNCKPVFIKHRTDHLIYFRRPRPKLPGSAAILPALIILAKSQRREVEAICRLMTNHSAGAQMLNYLLRWWKRKPTLRMSEADWIRTLGLSKKEIRFGKKSLEAAGIAVEVQAHKAGRATFFSLDVYRFLKRLKSTIGLAVSALLKFFGVSPMGTDGSVQREQMGQSNGGQTVITESSTNLSHQNHDDDEKKPLSDSGEFTFQSEGRDEQQNQHDASRRFLEENGVKAPALHTASKHPLPVIQRAFQIAIEKEAQDIPAYALTVLQNGEYSPASPPIGTQPIASARSWQSGTTNKSSAVKTSFHKQLDEYEQNYMNRCAELGLFDKCEGCGCSNIACYCEKEVSPEHA